MNAGTARPVTADFSGASRRRVLRWASLATVLALAGCGLRLRGAPRLAFTVIRLQGSTTSLVAQELRTALTGAGVQVLSPLPPAAHRLPAADPAPALQPQAVLTVLTDQREKSVVGQTAAGQVRELQLRSRFRFNLATPAGKILLENTELLLERDISYSETAALAKAAEEALLYRDMQGDIVQQVMRRLAAVTAL